MQVGTSKDQVNTCGNENLRELSDFATGQSEGQVEFLLLWHVSFRPLTRR
jgi:hypothetical protein